MDLDGYIETFEHQCPQGGEEMAERMRQEAQGNRPGNWLRLQARRFPCVPILNETLCPSKLV